MTQATDCSKPSRRQASSFGKGLPHVWWALFSALLFKLQSTAAGIFAAAMRLDGFFAFVPLGAFHSPFHQHFQNYSVL
ncbi:MAG TPA: hypothetical protein H9943_04005 [Candidatus Ruthenibacterium avium]|uniref:Uncharacterized protein n=1 Tax=Candidatus Ruthenibacterium avium TaxID=2838751 RepID=A0A9D2M129_9FIRM|nr:hypothetical protein [Candidatus Ruthenibacterium avium]